MLDVDGMWGPWGESACSYLDCEGVMNKIRACNSPPPALSGDPCDDSVMGPHDLNLPCNVHLGECPGKFVVTRL